VPTYQYACTNPEGKHEFELVQSFTDAPVSECPECGAPVRKVYGSVGVVFKGSGFYRTDSRTQDKERAAAGSTNGSPGTKADDAAKTVEKTGTGDGAKTGAGRKGEPESKKAASTPAA
jgi:putative FmdB family regulatory protein